MKTRLLLPLCAILALPLAGCGKSDAPADTAPAAAPTQVGAVNTPPPNYPVELACAGTGGTVVLDVVVGIEGKPTSVQVQTSSGQPALDQAAQTRVHDWLFNAATRNGKPVEQKIQVPVTFNPPEPRPDECFSLDERNRRGG
ncbi:energy transducer TonB [Stenotrophomonas sp. MMGLT7]|uniref:energy transducer TonB n=1 Tax=Stenotrophomonas sp. MMGLT7 TaxID=2901227 RepID=UPI001E57535A|nr:energy transducer TonB [Stenotrophomonas sp. MMGLT7]MCD7097233.1 energy transducer TonB [Stenotrophomonas sp. MMGLT7]